MPAGAFQIEAYVYFRCIEQPVNQSLADVLAIRLRQPDERSKGHDIDKHLAA